MSFSALPWRLRLADEVPQQQDFSCNSDSTVRLPVYPNSFPARSLTKKDTSTQWLAAAFRYNLLCSVAKNSVTITSPKQGIVALLSSKSSLSLTSSPATTTSQPTASTKGNEKFHQQQPFPLQLTPAIKTHCKAHTLPVYSIPPRNRVQRKHTALTSTASLSDLQLSSHDEVISPNLITHKASQSSFPYPDPTKTSKDPTFLARLSQFTKLEGETKRYEECTKFSSTVSARPSKSRRPYSAHGGTRNSMTGQYPKEKCFSYHHVIADKTRKKLKCCTSQVVVQTQGKTLAVQGCQFRSNSEPELSQRVDKLSSSITCMTLLDEEKVVSPTIAAASEKIEHNLSTTDEAKASCATKTSSPEIKAQEIPSSNAPAASKKAKRISSTTLALGKTKIASTAKTISGKTPHTTSVVSETKTEKKPVRNSKKNKKSLSSSRCFLAASSSACSIKGQRKIGKKSTRLCKKGPRTAHSF